MNFELEERMLEIEQKKGRNWTPKITNWGRTTYPGERESEEEIRIDTKQGTKPNTVKLPELDFKKFSGGLLNWPEFWDSFDSAIHCNPFLSPAEKMNYLRAQLEGDAADVISGLPLTNANYEQLMQIMDKMRSSLMFIVLVLWINLPPQVKHQPCVRTMIC